MRISIVEIIVASAVLIGLSIAAWSIPVDEATLSAPMASPPAIVVGIAAHGEFDGTGSTIYRVWSDGLVEQNRTACVGCGWAGWAMVPED